MNVSSTIYKQFSTFVLAFYIFPQFQFLAQKICQKCNLHKFARHFGQFLTSVNTSRPHLVLLYKIFLNNRTKLFYWMRKVGQFVNNRIQSYFFLHDAGKLNQNLLLSKFYYYQARHFHGGHIHGGRGPHNILEFTK